VKSRSWGCGVAIVLTIAGCASPDIVPPVPSAAPRVDLPLSAGGGVGSEYGNYPTEQSGETTGPNGEHCVLFTWDRPLTPALAIRYRSMSCEAKDHPGAMLPIDLGHTIVPIGQTDLKDLRPDADHEQ
jgi:hypothetical protein